MEFRPAAIRPPATRRFSTPLRGGAAHPSLVGRVSRRRQGRGAASGIAPGVRPSDLVQTAKGPGRDSGAVLVQGGAGVRRPWIGGVRRPERIGRARRPGGGGGVGRSGGSGGARRSGRNHRRIFEQAGRIVLGRERRPRRERGAERDDGPVQRSRIPQAFEHIDDRKSDFLGHGDACSAPSRKDVTDSQRRCGPFVAREADGGRARAAGLGTILELQPVFRARTWPSRRPRRANEVRA
jgi:hypothetical protein